MIAFNTSPLVITKCIKLCLQGSDIILEKTVELIYLNMNLSMKTKKDKI